MEQKDYDNFLSGTLKGKIKRIDPKYSYSKGILHECLQSECGRTWKPIPKEIVETNKNYCPSCVMSWSNRTDRFFGWREWYLIFFIVIKILNYLIFFIVIKII